VALENARLFEEAQSRRREAEQAEAAARDSEARYRGLIEHSIQGIFIHQDFVIRLANRAFAHMFGYDDPEELVGEDLRRFVAPAKPSASRRSPRPALRRARTLALSVRRATTGRSKRMGGSPGVAHLME